MAVPAITNNSPAAGQIAWAAFSIQYQGVTYTVSAGSTASRWVWWEYRSGTPAIVAGADIPTTLTDDDVVLFGNKNGIGLRVQATSVIDGELIVDGSVFADAIAANQISSTHIVTAGLDAGVVKFGTMNGDRIAVNTLQGDRLLANSVLVSKLAVADWLNYTTDPYFDLNRWSAATGITVAAISDMPLGIGTGSVRRFDAGAGSTTREADSLDKIAATPADVFRSSVWVRKITAAASPTGVVSNRLRYYNSAGVSVSPFYVEASISTSAMVQNTWYEILLDNVVVPAGITDIEQDLIMLGVNAADDFEFALPSVNKKYNGNLIVDGTILAQHIKSKTIGTDQLAADAITADMLTAGDALITGLLQVAETVSEAVSTAGLFVGPNISLTVEGGLVVQTPTGTTVIPADGQAPTFTGSATFDALTALGNLKIQGVTNEIAKGSTVKLAAGVSAPKSKPSGTPFWPTHKIHDGFQPHGLAYHLGTDLYFHGESLGGAVISRTKRNAANGDYELQFGQIAITSATDQGFGAWGRSEVTSSMGGVTVYGNNMYVLCDTNETIAGTFSGKMYVYQGTYNSGTGKWDYVRRWLYEPTTSGTNYMGGRGKYRPAIGINAVTGMVLIAQCDDGGKAFITMYQADGTFSVKQPLYTSAATLTQWSPARTMAAVEYTNLPVGGSPSALASYLVVTYNEALVRNFDPSNFKNLVTSDKQFTLPTSSPVGFRWDYQTGKFMTRSTSSLYDHSDITYATVAAVMTWRKANATAPAFAAYETDKSPRWVTTNFPSRAYLLLDSGTIPDDITDPNDPDAVSFYASFNDLTDTAASYHRVSTPAAGVQTFTMAAPIQSGGAPPSAPNFPTATPGRFTSDDGTLIDLRGTGQWRLGDISGDTNGRVIGGAFIPIGGMLPWVGAPLSPPSGFLSCWGGTCAENTYPLLFANLLAAGGTPSGTAPNRTIPLPDLRDRVVYGAGLGASKGTYSTGGSDTVTMPDHNHGTGTYITATVDLNLQTNTTTGGSANRTTQQNHSHAISGSSGIVVGTNPPIGNIPKYFATQYIIRAT